jgi:hypothetical protein
MELLHRRTILRRRVKPIKSRVAKVRPRTAVASGLAAVGGLVGLSAGSAAVSARRRRSEQSSNDS